MKRYKCCVSYVGAHYAGWQCQKHGKSIQEEIEKVIEHITRKKIRITAAGRTDAGVNAKGQVFHFDTDLEMTAYKWKGALNGYLPKDIRIVHVEEVDELFHARYCVKWKRYDYKINLGEYDVFTKDFIYQCPYPLDIDRMKKASEYFVGTHDFTSYCGNSLEETPDQVRTVFAIDFKQENDVLTISYFGQGFLRYMVRMMSAQLIDIGRCLEEPEYIEKVLQAKSKTMSRKNARAEGLTLMEIGYFELIAETDEILVREPLYGDVLPFDWKLEELQERIQRKASQRIYTYTTRNTQQQLGFLIIDLNSETPFELLLEDQLGSEYYDFENQLERYLYKQDPQLKFAIRVDDLKNVENRLRK